MPNLAISDRLTAALQTVTAEFNQRTGRSLTWRQFARQQLKSVAVQKDLAAAFDRLREEAGAQAESDFQTATEAETNRLMADLD